MSPNDGAQVQEKVESVKREGELAGEDGARGDGSGEQTLHLLCIITFGYPKGCISSGGGSFEGLILRIGHTAGVDLIYTPTKTSTYSTIKTKFHMRIYRY